MDEHDRRAERVKVAIREDGSGFTAVILAMAYAEYYLKRLIASKMPGGSEKFFAANSQAYIGFATLVRLADSLGLLPEGFAGLLKRFARLRNRYAHDIDYKLTETEVQSIVDAEASKFGPLMQAFLPMMQEAEVDRPLKSLAFFVTYMLRILESEYANRVDPERKKTLDARQQQAIQEAVREVGRASFTRLATGRDD